MYFNNNILRFLSRVVEGLALRNPTTSMCVMQGVNSYRIMKILEDKKRML
jgi:hypothetical protein